LFLTDIKFISFNLKYKNPAPRDTNSAVNVFILLNAFIEKLPYWIPAHPAKLASVTAASTIASPVSTNPLFFLDLISA